MPGEQFTQFAEAAHLIELLDRYIFLRGDTLTSYTSNDRSSFQTPTSLISTNLETSRPSKTNTPASLRYFPEIELSDHLRSLELEREETKDLTAKIVSICLNEDVVILAKSQIVAKYSILRPFANVDDFKVEGITKMLALLRAEQRRVNETKVRTISINVVTGIKSDGKVFKMEPLSLHKSASWQDLQNKLTKVTATWQAGEAGYPKGYSLKHGKWLYQTCKASVPERIMHDLATTQHYYTMREQTDRKSTSLLIWHEIVSRASQEAANQAKRDEMMWVESQPHNDDGTPMFGLLHLEELPQLMRKYMQELPAPEVEPLSEE